MEDRDLERDLERRWCFTGDGTGFGVGVAWLGRMAIEFERDDLICVGGGGGDRGVLTGTDGPEQEGSRSGVGRMVDCEEAKGSSSGTSSSFSGENVGDDGGTSSDKNRNASSLVTGLSLILAVPARSILFPTTTQQ